jgi:GT2 family glycosyltransferase
MKTITFIIATKDRPRDVRKLLQNLTEQSLRPDQVIIVDASAETDNNLIAEFSALDLRYIYHPKPSASAQRNEGIRAVSKEMDLIGFLDDDVILEPGAMDAMLRFWESAPEDVGGCGFNLKNFVPSGMERLKHLSLTQRLGLYSPEKGIVMPSGWQTMIGEVYETTFVQWLPIGASLWRRTIFEKFHFEEYFEGYSYLEDLDFSYGVSSQCRLVVVADAGFYHYHSSGGRVSSYKFGKIEVANRLFFVKKHCLSLVRCYMALLIRLGITLGRAFGRRDGSELRRALGNGVGLLHSLFPGKRGHRIASKNEG